MNNNTKEYKMNIVKRNTVEVDGHEYPRCHRAVGSERCYGWVAQGQQDCGGHG